MNPDPYIQLPADVLVRICVHEMRTPGSEPGVFGIPYEEKEKGLEEYTRQEIHQPGKG